MTDDLHSLAARIDALEQIIADANADKAEVYRDAKKVLREDLPAFREAMAQRRKRDKNPAAYEALKGRAGELLEILDTGLIVEHARAPARARGQTPPRTATSTPVVAPQAERGGEGRVSADPVPPSPAGGPPPPSGPTQAAASSPGGAVPAGDPDEHWEKRDGEGNFILAHQVANGRVPHPNPAAVRARLEAEARADTPAVAQIAGRALASLRDDDTPEMSAYLRRQAPSPRGM
jgi:uncharacterized protein (UPF0335 family)